MKLIQFVKNSGPYSPGDTAGFAAADADAYVARGDAVDVDTLFGSIELIEPAEAISELDPDEAINTAPTRKSRK